MVIFLSPLYKQLEEKGQQKGSRQPNDRVDELSSEQQQAYSKISCTGTPKVAQTLFITKHIIYIAICVAIASSYSGSFARK